MMCCLVQPIGQIFLKGYGFLSFAKNVDEDIGKNLSGKYRKKLFDHTKQSTTDSLDTVSKRVIHKKKKKKQRQLVVWLVIELLLKLQKYQKGQNNSETVTNEHDKEIPKERQKTIDDLRLI